MKKRKRKATPDKRRKRVFTIKKLKTMSNEDLLALLSSLSPRRRVTNPFAWS